MSLTLVPSFIFQTHFNEKQKEEKKKVNKLRIIAFRTCTKEKGDFYRIKFLHSIFTTLIKILNVMTFKLK